MLRAPALALAMLLAPAGSAFSASAYDLVEDLPYSTAHPDLVFDWYRPAGPGPHPAAVFVHGAFLAGGDKADVRTAEPNVLLLDMLLAHGVTVFSINVRPFPEFIHPAQLEDAGVAIQFLRHHATRHAIDPNRLAVWGQSGGAVICGWLAYGPDLAATSGPPPSLLSTRPEAFVNSVGLSDWQLLHPGLPGWMFGKATLGEVDAGLLKSASFAQNVLDVTRTSTPPVASLFPGPIGTPPLLDVHDTLMMKVLHANLATGFPAVAAQSRELTRAEHPTEGTRQELVTAWLLELFGLPSDVIDLGHAVPGAGGTPSLAAGGSFTAGGAFALEMQAAGTTPATLFVVAGEERVNLPLFGGTLLPDPMIVVVFPTDASGHVTLPGTVPAIAPPGHVEYLQFWHQDAGAAGGWAASNGLRIALH